MKFQAAIKTSNPHDLKGLQAGQWIDYEGTQGRYMGRRNGTVWIAWGGTARERFSVFAQAFKA